LDVGRGGGDHPVVELVRGRRLCLAAGLRLKRACLSLPAGQALFVYSQKVPGRADRLDRVTAPGFALEDFATSAVSALPAGGDS
jgi:hypothetical protein